MHRYSKAVLAIALVAAASAAAYAANGHENDAAAVTHAKVSLTQAVAVASRHSPGAVARAEYEDSASGPVYDVEIVRGAKVYDVRVDADQGAVIAVSEDAFDSDDSGVARD